MLEIGHSWSISMILRLETFSSHVNFNGNWHYVLKKVITDFHGLVSWKQQILWTTCLLNLILRIFLELGISSFSKEVSTMYYLYISPRLAISQNKHRRDFKWHEYFVGIQENQNFFNIRIWYFRIFQTFKLCNFKQL